MNKFMRMIVFFDLPTVTKEEKHNAAKFRSFLQKDGYYMMQWSVYSRLCNGLDNVELHKRRLAENLPPKGSIRTLVLTEKQYDKIDVILGVTSDQEKTTNTDLLEIF